MINIITKGIHHKVKKNMLRGFQLAGIKYVCDANLNSTKLIYSPAVYINPKQYPDKKFIFGPSFDFRKSYDFSNVKNALYLQPSQQSVDIRKALGFRQLPYITYYVGIDTEEFKPSNNPVRDTIFVYEKDRNPSDYQFVKDFLTRRGIKFQVVRYGKYKEEDYKKILARAKYGIWIGRQESQGIALEEALSFNVPLLVWNISKRGDEVPLPPDKKPVANMFATTIPYWDDRCGMVFYKSSELESTFDNFVTRLSTFQPRQFILENFDLADRAKQFLKFYEKI